MTKNQLFNHPVYWEAGYTEHLGFPPHPGYIVDEGDESGQQYDCLTMTLEDGLDLLQDLTKIQKIWLER